MKNNPAPIRQKLACGLEPPIAGATAWSPSGFKGDDPTTCAGYTSRLPQVIEAARAASWKADLATYVGMAPSQALVFAVDEYEDQRNACERWWFKKDSEDRS